LGLGPVGASFFKKSCSDESSLSVEPLSLPHSQPMFGRIGICEIKLLRCGRPNELAGRFRGQASHVHGSASASASQQRHHSTTRRRYIDTSNRYLHHCYGASRYAHISWAMKRESQLTHAQIAVSIDNSACVVQGELCVLCCLLCMLILSGHHRYRRLSASTLGPSARAPRNRRHSHPSFRRVEHQSGPHHAPQMAPRNVTEARPFSVAAAQSAPRRPKLKQ
jgi:hypothetical protein